VNSKVLLNFLARLKRVGKVGGNGGKDKEVEGMWKKVEVYAVGRLTDLKEKCGREMDDALVSVLFFWSFITDMYFLRLDCRD
jgi:hypothetical protein